MEMSNLLKEMFESEVRLSVQSFTSPVQRDKDVGQQQIHVTFPLVLFSMKCFQCCGETAQLWKYVCRVYTEAGPTAASSLHGIR